MTETEAEAREVVREGVAMDLAAAVALAAAMLEVGAEVKCQKWESSHEPLVLVLMCQEANGYTTSSRQLLLELQPRSRPQRWRAVHRPEQRCTGN